MHFFYLKFFVQFASCVYFVRNFPIKPFTCVVFIPDCHKKSYGLDYTVESDDKVTVCNVWIIKVSTIWKWNSLQCLSLYRHQLSNFSKDEKLILYVCCISFFRIFLVLYIIVLVAVTVLITSYWQILSWVYIKIWSIKVEVLQVILVGQFVNLLRPYIEQNTLYFFISAKNLDRVF